MSRRAAAGDLELHVLDYGGDRPPLLVIPGITSPAITWDFVVAPLRDLTRPVVVDLRGRGLSDAGASYAIDDFAQDAEAVIAALQLDEPVILGHSLGARVAAAVAARGNQRLTGTIIVDPPLSGPGRPPYPTSREAFLEQLHEAQAGTTADEVARFYPGWPRCELALRARWLPSCDEHAVMASYEAFHHEDFFEHWPHVPAPTLFVRGGTSPVITAEGAREVAEANPGATQAVIPEAGHMIPWDNFEAFISEIRSMLATWLGGVPAGQPSR